MVIALPHHPPPPHPPHSRSSSPAGFKMVKGLSEGAGSGSSSHASSAQQRPPRSLWRIETSVNAANSFHGNGGGGKAAGDGSGGGPMATASSSSAAAHHTATTSSAARPLTPPPSDSSLDRMTYSSVNASGSVHDSAAQPQRSSSGKSKNDIFERGSPLLTPPKPPPPILARRGGNTAATFDAMTPPSSAPASTTSTPASASAPKSRNSLFFDTPSSSPSFAVWRGGWQPNVDASRQTSSPQAQAPPPLPTPPPVPSSSASPWDESKPLYTTTHLSRDTQRPSLGRLSSDEQQRERERIRGASGDVDFRLCPSKQYLLGEGRHCNVYLGSYRKRRGSASREEEWQLCAIKRLHADRQSQLLGLDEGFALRRLGPHPGIVELIDIRDEVMATTPAPASAATSQASLGMGRPASNSISLHGRSTSAAHGGAPGRSQQHMRLASQPAVRIEGDDYDYGQADEDDDVPSSASALAAQQSSNSSSTHPAPSPPRLLILLSLHPHSLATYSRRHSPSITLDFWLRTALDLSSTLSYLHSRGCVHADVKPENILLDGAGRTKLCDFNSAFFPGKASMPLTDGLGLGTPAYGAPELTKRTGGVGVVSYPIDVFSLGAVLYGLATGVEPMSRARSAVDMLHRKEHFFAMEENERLNRVAISQGWGNGGGSGTASRTSSMRSKRSKPPASTTASNNGSPPSRRSSLRTRRDSNESSLDGSASIASNVTTMGGQKPSVAAVQALLEPGEAAGVLPALLERSASGASSSSAGGRVQAVGASGHQRASSLNKARQDPLRSGNNGSSNTASGVGPEESGHSLHRPTWLRRTTSYGGPDGGAPGSNGMTPSPSHDSRLLSPPLSPHQSLLPAATLTGTGRSGGDGELSLAVAASFADASVRGSAAPSTSQSLQQRLLKQQSGASHGHARTPSVESTASYTSSASTTSSMAHSSPITSTSADQLVSPSPYDSAEEEEDEEQEIDTRPYLDGSPALLLPGGGRLPQAALDLVEEMLRVDPRRRPGMGEVGRRLAEIAGEVGWEQ